MHFDDEDFSCCHHSFTCYAAPVTYTLRIYTKDSMGFLLIVNVSKDELDKFVKTCEHIFPEKTVILRTDNMVFMHKLEDITGFTATRD